jgi:hypothetical protein
MTLFITKIVVSFTIWHTSMRKHKIVKLKIVITQVQAPALLHQICFQKKGEVLFESLRFVG